MTSSYHLDISNDDKIKALKASKIFIDTPRESLEPVTNLFQSIQVKSDNPVFEKGDVGDALYVIMRGRVRVHVGDRTLNYLGDGDTFGEMAVIDSAARSATVTCIVDTVLLRLSQDGFHQMMGRIPGSTIGLMRVLNEHLRRKVERNTESSFQPDHVDAFSQLLGHLNKDVRSTTERILTDMETDIPAEAYRMLDACTEGTTRNRFKMWLDSGWLKPQAMIWLLSMLSWRQAETFLLWICPQTQGSIQAVAHEMQIGRDTVNTHRDNAKMTLEDALEIEFPVGRGAQVSIYDWAVKLDLLDPYVERGCFQQE